LVAHLDSRRSNNNRSDSLHSKTNTGNSDSNTNSVDSSPKMFLQDISSHRSNSPNTGSTSSRLLLVLSASQLLSRLHSKMPALLLHNHSSISRPLSKTPALLLNSKTPALLLHNHSSISRPLSKAPPLLLNNHSSISRPLSRTPALLLHNHSSISRLLSKTLPLLLNNQQQHQPDPVAQQDNQLGHFSPQQGWFSPQPANQQNENPFAKRPWWERPLAGRRMATAQSR
jgi:hypothetical protein